MKKISVFIIVTVLFWGCNGCKNDNNNLIGDVSIGDDVINIQLNDALGNRSIVFTDSSGKTINYVAATPISVQTKRLLEIQLGASKGTFFRYDEIDNVISSIANTRLNYKDQAGSTISRVVFPETDKFRLYTTFGKIDPTLLEESRAYRNKLLQELKDYYNEDYQEFLMDDGVTIDQPNFYNAFRDKYTLIYQIAYGKQLVETNKYWITDENNKVNTIFDVGAVCPPVCP